ncbi:uncharacterized protein LOC112688871 isoform X2 [Sipha flava]|uniref:Uncharacterized protein LOC112688871 isoform X2 n=1 Tax=Sipha flava TaxID=143950 RepID=A0A8B8G656_9HEMI|nr:uncharacterized protein LOC112688871 isoform X2 [Sipha flava]
MRNQYVYVVAEQAQVNRGPAPIATFGSRFQIVLKTPCSSPFVVAASVYVFATGTFPRHRPGSTCGFKLQT